MEIPSNNNASSFFFVLMDLPGLESAHCWTAIPICLIYGLSLLGNIIIMYIVKSVPSLHTPMYLFLSMLSVADLGLSASTLPSMAAVFLLGQRKVGAATCFVQLFFIHTFSVIESAVLLAMAFDRCVAIREPLRYATILTTQRIGAIGLAIVTRSAALHLPLPVLLGRLQFQPVNALSILIVFTLMLLARSSTLVNSGFGLFVMLSTLGTDAVLILLSYVMILKTVLSIASSAGRLKAFNTCISHICSVLLFYTPLVSLSMIHRFGKKKLPVQVYMLLSYLHFLVPPMLNPIVYSIKTKEIRVIMSDSNYTGTSFFLTGLPGLEAVHTWLSIPLCAMYVASLTGNSLILWVVRSEPSLHQPMTICFHMPSMLTIYMLGLREVALDVCLAQLFFIHTFSIMESSVLLTMAFDRVVAISNPLRYSTILTSPRIASLGLAIMVRSIGLHIPAPIMLKKLPYCRNRLLSHSYCLHPDVMKLACADTHTNSAYGLFVVLSTLGVDAVLIVLSYVLILHTVLSIASKAERLKALNTCVSHICSVLLFYTPMIGLSMIHRFGRWASPCSRVLLSYLHFLTPPVLNPTKQIRLRMLRLFRSDGAGIRDPQDH
ncbi:LOW QUALITY PROTEIN: hypothetical protein QTO34_003834 [Cnephaeus nilssonii]|uniref:G-protein coupled receptors family 1 profile domain-containing protein n=1 Tax=Cnephaeus nilssonii TaxID=3371016 RepID=A0AA40HRK3_CNENI|nr:LOW QUALITY PROTEIN: hypothetical protein QTO34_003834 [Eptesicus nilssonii]